MRRFLMLMLAGLLIFAGAAAQDADDVSASDYLFFFGGRGNFKGATENISAMAMTPDGSIILFDAFGNLKTFNQYGEEIDSRDDIPNGALAVDSDGNRYVVSDNSFTIYDADWTETIKFDLLTTGYYPVALALDEANGILYGLLGPMELGGDANIKGMVIASGRVVKDFYVAPDPTLGSNGPILPGSIAVTSDGQIVVGFGGISRSTQNLDAQGGAIRWYDPEGTLVTEIASDYLQEEQQTTAGMETFRFFPVPYGLTVDSEGRVYAYEVQNLPPLNFGDPARISGVLSIYAPNGTLLRQFPVSQQDSPVGAHVALSLDESLLYVSSQNFVHVIALTTEPPFTTRQMAENGRFRSGAGSNFDVAGAAEAGDIIIVTGQNEAGDWLQIREDGAEAWVAEFLTAPLER